MSFSLWASRTALSGHIRMNYSKIINSSQASSPGNLDNTISPKTLTVCKNDENQCNSKSRAVSSVSGTILPRHIHILSVSRWRLGTEVGSFHGRTYARSLSHDTFHASPQRPHQGSQSPTASNGQKAQAASSYVSHSDDIFDPPPDTSTSLISPRAFHTHSHCCSINLHHLSLSCKSPCTDILPSFLRLPDSQSGGISLSLPQQPAASSVSSQPPPKDPALSSINQRGIEPLTPERRISHIKRLLLNLKIRIASCETHARQQGLKREEIWTKFELDRMRIEAHQMPDRRLEDHWKVIVENKVPFETLQLGLTEAFDSNANLCAYADPRT
jgi:hypothetical protein